MTKWEDVVPALEDKCAIVMPWCEREACEDDVKERSGQRCVSFDLFLKFDASSFSTLLKKLGPTIFSSLACPLLISPFYTISEFLLIEL